MANVSAQGSGQCVDAHTGDPDKPKHVTVLHIDPALSPTTAVIAFIIQEFRNNASAQG